MEHTQLIDIDDLSRGLLNLAGQTASSKAEVLKLLDKDFKFNHCYYHSAGLHNHLSHHLLVAYDLGAPASLLRSIFSEENRLQRPIDLSAKGIVIDGIPKEGEINDDNWDTWLGDQRVYGPYLTFFSGIVARKGTSRALEEYVFSANANEGNRRMLLRFMGGLVHPMIQIGLANPLDDYRPISIESAVGNQSGLSLLGVLRAIYDSDILKPVQPYPPDYSNPQRFIDLLSPSAGRGPELQKLINRWSIDPDNIDLAVEECFWVMTLIHFSVGRVNRKVRLDFQTMHFITSVSLLPSLLRLLETPQYKVDLLRMWMYIIGIWFIDRGRPRVDPSYIMRFTDTPAPPTQRADLKTGTASIDNPWPAIVQDVIHAPDAHTIKVFRSLYYSALHYGTTSAGAIPGSVDPVTGEEYIAGISKVDGSLFIRSAGVLMDYMGWVSHGQAAGMWERSGLGWDEAWEIPDEENEKHWAAMGYEDMGKPFEGKVSDLGGFLVPIKA
ncbi:hypothetical protein SISSUDRAFT_1028618 [Sistotremastrum suecicum HHB10207 ss-3]|uniref:Uncharacterized protein n=1 Tax=Sistotremastrum suecicum HHB10207 ss-3 TaxID=1314776 RepID=A0A165XKY8_9AGAM|nr:hypothetical protein SISSUDRAFT_1028618 [Sistotremastrum suecicum HHB10207 ss-3]